MEIIDNEKNIYYFKKNYEFIQNTYGRWEIPFDDYSKVAKACEDAVEKGYADMAYHTGKLRFLLKGKGSCSFFIGKDEFQGQKRLLKFLIHRGLMPRDEKGMLVDIPFLIEKNVNSDYKNVRKISLNTFLK